MLGLSLLLCAAGTTPLFGATDTGTGPRGAWMGHRPETLPASARLSEHVYGLAGLSNVGRVAPGIYRGAQPEPAGYQTLRNMGIRTVISLRAHHSEKEEVESAGMVSVEIPMEMLKGVDQAAMDKVLEVMTDPANQPVYLHCALGEDRTGTVVAVYRMEKERWPYAEAEAEMQAFGFNDIWIHLKTYLRNYADGHGK